VIAAVLLNLNNRHILLLLNEFNDFSTVRVALMSILKHEAGLEDNVDLTEIFAMLLEVFYVFLSPLKLFLKLILSIFRQKVHWHSPKICYY
jgi:hypothetical protein